MGTALMADYQQLLCFAAGSTWEGKDSGAVMVGTNPAEATGQLSILTCAPLMRLGDLAVGCSTCCRACRSRLWLPQCSSALQDCLAVTAGATLQTTLELPAGHGIAEPSSSKTGRHLVNGREYSRCYKNATSRDLKMEVIYWWEKTIYPRDCVFPVFSQEVKMCSSLSGWLSHGDFRPGSCYSACWERAEGASQNWKLPFCANSDQWPWESPVKQRLVTSHGQASSQHPCGACRHGGWGGSTLRPGSATDHTTGFSSQGVPSTWL